MNYAEMPTQKYRVTATFEIEVDAETWEGQPIPDEIIQQAIQEHLASSTFDEHVTGLAYEDSGYVRDDEDDEVDLAVDVKVASNATPSVRLSPILPHEAASSPTDLVTANPVPLSDSPAPDNYWTSRPLIK